MKSLRNLALSVCGLPLLASMAFAGNVTINVIDQNGVGYSPGQPNNGQGTTITVLGTGTPTITSGSSVTLDPGTYTIRAYPSPRLFRDFQAVEVTAATTEINLLWESRTVALRVVDQHGVLLPNTNVGIVYRPSVPNGGSVRVPINDSSFYPTLGDSPDNYRFDVGSFFNSPTGTRLNRYIWGNVVGDTTTVLEHEWQTADVTFHLLDQHGVDIGDWAAAIGVTGFGAGASPYTITMPVNDSSFYTDLGQGQPWTDHYEWSANAMGSALARGWMRWMATPGQVLKVTPGMTDFTLVWHMQDVLMRVVDQNGFDLPPINGERNSTRPIGMATYNWPRPYGQSGDTWRLPVNDPSLYPSLYGSGYAWNESAADGYDFWLVLDSNFSNTSMYQGGFVVTPTTTQINVPWMTQVGPLFVVDSGGIPVAGSTFQITNPTGGGDVVRSSGDTVTLAVTDNATYPNLRGGLTNGFPILVNPGDVAGSASYLFEVMPDGSFDPPQFIIDGQTYALRFLYNTLPVADAGDNLTVLTQDLATTVIMGSASDLDGDAMTYRWLDALDAELQGSLPTGSLGEAPLALAGIPDLGLGAHTFVLEVSDGQGLDTSSITVFVDNSPPIAVAGGDVNTEEERAILLTGTVADYDGDVLSYTWSDAGVSLAFGTTASLNGGAPLDLPAHLIVEGLSLGSHVLTLTVDDGFNPPAISTMSVNVLDDKDHDGHDDDGDGCDDDEGPRLAPVVTPAVLWPLNDQMVPVTIYLNATDLSGPIAYDVKVQCSRNAKKNHQGDTLPNYTTPVIDPVLGTVNLMLRASESKRGKGVTYKIKIKATDIYGNEAEATVKFGVPKGRRNHD